MSAENLTKRPG